jgi:hypothetical protein
VERLIADTGFLVALGREADPLHPAASQFLRGFRGNLITVTPVVAETCFFLDTRARAELLAWCHAGGPTVVDVPVASFPELAATFRAYADREVDFADAALVWLANRSGLRRILTVDAADFGVFRLKGRKRFELIDWF